MPALIEFENDVVCQFTAAYTAGGRLERYELHGDYVSVYLQGVKSRLGCYATENRVSLQFRIGTRTTESPQARCFVRSVSDGVDFPSPAATLETSAATLRLCESILNSVDSTVSAY